MSTLELNRVGARILKLNPIPVGPEDNRKLIYFTKIAAQVTASILDYFHPDLKDALLTDKGESRFGGVIGSVKLEAEIRHMEIDLDPKGLWSEPDGCQMRFHDVPMKKFEVRPLGAGMVELGFEVALEPVGRQVVLLGEFALRDEILISAYSEDRELPLEDTRAKPKETPPTKPEPAPIDWRAVIDAAKQPMEAGTPNVPAVVAQPEMEKEPEVIEAYPVAVRQRPRRGRKKPAALPAPKPALPYIDG